LAVGTAVGTGTGADHDDDDIAAVVQQSGYSLIKNPLFVRMSYMKMLEGSEEMSFLGRPVEEAGGGAAAAAAESWGTWMVAVAASDSTGDGGEHSWQFLDDRKGND
jgi:hypothetical protein